MGKSRIDTEWFVEQLRARKISQRGLARALGLDIWSVWHMLRGGRRMQIVEARQIADILGVPVTEILRHAGLEEVTVQMVPIIGIVRGSGAVTLETKPVDQVAAPMELPPDAIALLARTARTPLQFADGCVFYTRLTRTVDEAAVGRLALVKPVGHQPILRLVKRTRSADQYRLVLLREDRSPVQLEWAAPIMWIRP